MPSSQQKKKAYQHRVNIDHISCTIFEARSKLTKTFKKLQESVAKQILWFSGRTMCRIPARRLLIMNMPACKEHAGFCSRVLRTLSPSRSLKGRTLVKGVTLWPQSNYSMTQLPSM